MMKRSEKIKIRLMHWINYMIRDAIHTHFVIGKWTILSGWVKHLADKRGKVAKLKYKSFVTSLERADNKTGRVGKKRIVHLPICVTKWVWMASLSRGFFVNCYNRTTIESLLPVRILTMKMISIMTHLSSYLVGQVL